MGEKRTAWMAGYVDSLNDIIDEQKYKSCGEYKDGFDSACSAYWEFETVLKGEDFV